MKCYYYVFLYYVLSIFSQVSSKIHRLTIEDDTRPFIKLTNFGFYPRGYLYVSLDRFSIEKTTANDKLSQNDMKVGFSLEKVLHNDIDPNWEIHRGRCLLQNIDNFIKTEKNFIFFTLDFKNSRLNVTCNPNSIIGGMQIFDESKLSSLLGNDKGNENIFNFEKDLVSCANYSLPLKKLPKLDGKDGMFYVIEFGIYVPTEKEQGLYELWFHNCANFRGSFMATSFSMLISERNYDNYLSAGEMPLPAMYFWMSVLFFLSAILWVYILVRSRHPVFKIHYLMAALVFLKSLGLLFHSINYHYIEIKGEHVVTWAILYYVTHLLRGSVLFITLIIIGTGWSFIKHILAPRDKKMFMVVIPLQVFTNVAEIILEESEEGDARHETFRMLFISVDLLCCLLILFPIVWSIKHLQAASETDGKAARNLEKLELFRHFYILIVSYIYFTRMIVFLLKQTLDFRYVWLNDMFRELATFAFFVVTAYKFRPAAANPYFKTSEDDDSNDMDIIVNQYGFSEGLTKLSRISNETGENDKDTLLIYKRESNHDYD